MAHSDWPRWPLYVPAGHAWHWPPSTENCPTSHGSHELAPSAELLPAGHASQRALPSTAWKVPAAHAAQEAAVAAFELRSGATALRLDAWHMIEHATCTRSTAKARGTLGRAADRGRAR